MNLLLTGAYEYSREQLEQLKQLGFSIVYVQNELETIAFDVSRIDVVVCNALFLNNEIKKFKNLKVIQLTSVGLDRVPLEYIQQKNIKLYTAEDTYSIPIAEFAVMSILNIYKQYSFFQENKLSRQWVKNRNICELTNKNVLIMGYGNIGKEIAKRLKPFGTIIYAYDIVEKELDFIDYFMTEYENILPMIDVIILCLPLVEETFHIIDNDFINKLKDNVSLVNVARGKLINEGHLISAIKANKFIGIALDVFDTEPLATDNQLWDFDNVYITPHNSYVSNKNSERLFDVILKNLGEKHAKSINNCK